MSIVMTKGVDFSGQYTVSGIEGASDWVGSASLYADYPHSSAFLTKQLVYNGTIPAMILSIPLGDLLDIPAGMYQMVATISSATLDISVNKLDYVTLLAAGNLSSEPVTLLTMTVLKSDGTPAGKETKTLVNNGDGTTSIALSWDGVQVTINNAVADEVSGNIINTEPIVVRTDAAGYAQAAVLRGMTVKVSCPYFGKTIDVDTTGQETIDLSQFF